MIGDFGGALEGYINLSMEGNDVGFTIRCFDFASTPATIGASEVTPNVHVVLGLVC